MRRIAILQSNFIPWRGYFDLIDDADVFVIYDDVQYTKNDWRNRNKIKTSVGPRWITVPVRHVRLNQHIDATKIDESRDWRADHRNKIESAYKAAAFYPVLSQEFFDLIGQPNQSLSDMNVSVMRWLMQMLGISTDIVYSRDLGVSGVRTERLLGIVEHLGGDTYLSGPSASAYLDVEMFRRAGVGLEYKQYRYDPYPQLWGDFEGAVTALDLVFNTGPDARRHLKSRAQAVAVR